MGIGLIFIFIWLIQLIIFDTIAVFVISGVLKNLGSAEQQSASDEIRMSLGEIVKQHRIKAKSTQEFVAEELGVSRQAVFEWERGESEPKPFNLIAIGEIYGVSAEQLLEEAAQ